MGPSMIIPATRRAIKNGTADISSVYVELLLGSYTPSLSHTTRADISASIIADGDYARQTVASQAFSAWGSTALDKFSTADISFGGSVELEWKYSAFMIGNPAAVDNADLLWFVNDHVETVGVITAITSASPAAITDASHGLSTSDYVFMYNTGIPVLDNRIHQVTVSDANTFTVPVDTSGYAAGNRGAWIKINDTTMVDTLSANSNGPASVGFGPDATNGWFVG